MSKEFLMSKRLSGDCRDLSSSYRAPEFTILLTSYKFGIMEEGKGIVPYKTAAL